MSTAPRHVIATLLAVCAPFVTAACEKHEFEPPDAEQRVAEGEAAFDPAVFDTIAWASDSARLAVGNEIFAARCRDCHGYLGEGGTEYAAQRDLDPPSLVAEDWELAGDLGAVIHRIFVGHPSGMPTWGVAGLEPREIDAVAYYIVYGLRAEVLGEAADSASR